MRLSIVIFVLFSLLLFNCSNIQSHKKGFEKNSSSENKKADSIKQNLLFLHSFDSLTKNWDTLKPPNPTINFQRQYSGIIDGKPAVFNVNLRAINIREQKDITIWATIDTTLTEFYIYEDDLYGEALNENNIGKIQICKDCQSPKTKYKQKKYLLGYVENPVTGPGDLPPLAIRFSKDSSQIEGFLAKDSNDIHPIHFWLTTSTPSIPLEYNVTRFHKHQKMQDGEIVEVPSTVVLGLDLPNKSNTNYASFLKYQGVHTSLQNTKTIYKKKFDKKKKQSHVKWSRSMMGSYKNSDIVFNQHNWLIIETEEFEGFIGYYGEFGNDFICYDITRNKFLNEDDVLIEHWDDSTNISKLNNSCNYHFHFRGFAFVCPLGVILRISGNHGWDVGLFFVRWNNIKPFLKPSFIRDYHYFWDSN